MTTLTQNSAARDAALRAGPFHPAAETTEKRNELGRAVLTSLLALYPVLATVGVVLVSLAFSGSI